MTEEEAWAVYGADDYGEYIADLSRGPRMTCDRCGASMPNYMAAYIGDDTVCPKCWGIP